MNKINIFRAFFGVIGIIMIIFGVYYTFSQFSMLGRCDRIKATVVDIHVETSIEKGKTVTSRYPIYEFMDPSASGEVLRRQSRGGGSNTPQIGDRVAIIYDPADSYYVYEDTFMSVWGGSFISLFVGFIFILFLGFPNQVVEAIRSRLRYH